MLIDLLDEAFDKKSWHGPNLRGSIRGLTAKQAAWRPNGDRHNIWELTLHAAYWKYIVRRRLASSEELAQNGARRETVPGLFVGARRTLCASEKTGEKRESFVLPGSNFFVRPLEETEQASKADVSILTAEHRKLRAVVWELSSPSRAQAHMIRGVAAHDLYHAGQIRLLRRLYSCNRN